MCGCGFMSVPDVEDPRKQPRGSTRSRDSRGHMMINKQNN